MNVDVVDPEEAALGLRLSGRLARPMSRTEVESHSRRVRSDPPNERTLSDRADWPQERTLASDEQYERSIRELNRHTLGSAIGNAQRAIVKPDAMRQRHIGIFRAFLASRALATVGDNEVFLGKRTVGCLC